MSPPHSQKKVVKKAAGAAAGAAAGVEGAPSAAATPARPPAAVHDANNNNAGVLGNTFGDILIIHISV